MKVNLNLDQHCCTVEREPGDKRMPTESAFWYALKKALIAQGHDVIKKVMSKDGHLVGGDTYPYYIRTRIAWKKSNKPQWCIWDTYYAFVLIHEQYNTGLCISLTVENLSMITVKKEEE